MFKVSARTLLHLGAELISSDAVAFYELIKNAFDAQSKRVKIEVVSRLDYEVAETLRDLVAGEREHAASLEDDEHAKLVKDLRSQISIDDGTFEAKPLTQQFDSAKTLDELSAAIDAANYIVISDTGEGMSSRNLEDVYLTIGTAVRHRQRQAQEQRAQAAERPILGEKGIGRLSAMRLGWKVRVQTTKAGEERWNTLDIDWREFANLDKLIEQVKVEPSTGDAKTDPDVHGTILCISALASGWSQDKVEEIARTELSRFIDPFSKRVRFPISLRFNGEVVAVPPIEDLLFKEANMKVMGEFIVRDDDVHFEGNVEFEDKKTKLRRKSSIIRTSEQLCSLAKSSLKTLQRLGPFRLMFYWYNRQQLTAIDGIGDRQEVKKLLDRWSGVMLFRDGFRIHPYGNEDDDWLDFDRRALGSGGYKLNKAQFIGKVDISHSRNPYLIDQANREGLKDTSEKAALIAMLNNLVQTEIRGLINAWTREHKKENPAQVIKQRQERVHGQLLAMKKDLQVLADKTGEAELVREVTTFLRESVEDTLAQAANFVDAAQNEREIVIHLAGIGLMLEVVAHELKRATTAALVTVGKIRKQRKKPLSEEKLQQFADALHAQLKTLEKRVRILDPHSTAGRQRKEEFDVVEWTRTVLDTHAAQLESAEIEHECVVVGVSSKAAAAWNVHMVKGIFIQILENLINNSIYWLTHKKKTEKRFRPKLWIEIDPKQRTLKVVDNGPGIPFEQGDMVFRSFFTTRPHGESRGLGLYIAQENARYSKLEISLSEEPAFHPDRYNAFIIAWPPDEESS